jgi:hypothetical protein
MRIRFAQILLVGLLMALLPACSMFRFGQGAPAPLPASIEVMGSDYEDRLRTLVDDSLTKLQRHDSAENARMTFRKPYFYREYVAYPDGVDDYSLDIRASESLTTPYTAQIRLKKQRYVTKFERKREVTHRDTVFYESTGHETLSYELRHGRWREVGTLYVAEETDPRLKDVASNVRFGEDSLDPEKKGGLRKLFFWRD